MKKLSIVSALVLRTRTGAYNNWLLLAGINEVFCGASVNNSVIKKESGLKNMKP